MTVGEVGKPSLTTVVVFRSREVKTGQDCLWNGPTTVFQAVLCRPV